MSNPIPRDEGPESRGLPCAPPTTLATLPWFSLCWRLCRWTNRRFVYRLFQSVALSLAISESLLCLLGDSVGQSVQAVAHRIGATLFWTMLLTLLAGWYLAAGFFDPHTNQFLDALLKRRGHSTALRRTVETRTAAIWLGMLAGLPLLASSTVALARAHSPSELLLLARTSGLSLCTAELFALVVLWAILGLQGFALARPRQLIAILIGGPEILRLVDPAVPTLYTLAESVQTLVLRWSVWS